MTTDIVEEYQFFFYLDAWQHCVKFNIPLTNIKRKNWKVWVVTPE